MNYSKNVWNQLKGTKVEEIMAALTKDGWSQDPGSGPVFSYRKNPKRVTVHYHPKKTFGPKFLKGLIADIGWDEDDLLRLKLIKRK